MLKMAPLDCNLNGIYIMLLIGLLNRLEKVVLILAQNLLMLEAPYLQINMESFFRNARSIYY